MWTMTISNSLRYTFCRPSRALATIMANRIWQMASIRAMLSSASMNRTLLTITFAPNQKIKWTQSGEEEENEKTRSFCNSARINHWALRAAGVYALHNANTFPWTSEQIAVWIIPNHYSLLLVRALCCADLSGSFGSLQFFRFSHTYSQSLA